MPTPSATPLSANGRKALAVARHVGVDVRVDLVHVYRGEGRPPATTVRRDGAALRERLGRRALGLTKARRR
jgi:hypothetical protein